jgi:hypothetical protein
MMNDGTREERLLRRALNSFIGRENHNGHALGFSRFF